MSQSRDFTHEVNLLAESRPLVLPDKFSGEEDLSEWIVHFNNVSVINGWADNEKINWLIIRVTGKARAMLTRLLLKEPVTFQQAIDALRQRFDPPCKRELYKVMLEMRTRHNNESWADLGDSLLALVDKVYPDLQTEAREMIALDKYLKQLVDPQLSLAVRQQHPKTVVEAVLATIELETYITGSDVSQQVFQSDDQPIPIFDQQLNGAIQTLLDRIEALENIVKKSKEGSCTGFNPVTCHNCGQVGHYARGCANRELKSCNGEPERSTVEENRPMSSDINTITINCVSNYSLRLFIKGTWVSFLVDTGAAVSLIDGRVWDSMNGTVKLNPVNLHLVGVDGVPLKVQGSTLIRLQLCGLTIDQNFIVADALTSQGILGMDFLESNHCILDLAEGKLSAGGRSIPLDSHRVGKQVSACTEVTAEETFTIAPVSEMETMGNVDMDCTGTWLVEDRVPKKLPILVARAVVAPQNGKFPVRVLNLTSEPITVYKGTRIATSEPIEHTVEANIRALTDSASSRPWQQNDQCVKKLMGTLPASLDGHQQRQVQELLIKYGNIFASNSNDLGRTNILTHRIETTGSPIRQGIRRIPQPQKEAVKKLIDELKEKDIISPSKSPWASPVVLVPKKDGSIRLCIDYRKVNELTRKDAYPLPRVDDTLDTLAGAKWFSTLDLKSGYWQVEVHEDDRDKTAFCTHEGLFQFNVMPFGLCNAPATFQRLMDMVLKGLLWQSCLVYIDDIIIVGRTFEEHLSNLAQVFERLENAGLKLQPHKCHLLQSEVRFLGHIVSTQGVSPDPEKADKVKQWPNPTSTKEVQQFLGLASYYRRFVKNFSTIAAPLHKLTEKHSVFRWTPHCQEAFDHLKNQLVSAPILALPDWSKPFILDTDASDTGIGAVLSQVHDKGECVIAYASRTLTKAERNYCVTKKELLAVIVFLDHFRTYLLGTPFTIRTDHGSLTWIQKFKQPEGQIARWLQKLQEYQFSVVHRPGRLHSNADSMSRLPCRQCGLLPSENRVPISAVTLPELSLTAHTPSEIRASQLEDPTIGPILQSKERNQPPQISQADSLPHRRLAQLWDQLTVREGVLYRLFLGPDDACNHLQLVVPYNLRSGILEALHGGVVGGHLGHEKTFSRVRERFYWPGYWNDTRDWCLACQECSTRKSPTHSRRAPLGTVQAGYPTQIMAVDLLGPLPESDQKNSYIMVVGDYFTRWMEAIPIPNQEACTVADRLIDEVFMRYSVPEQLHSDQGSQFESKLIQEVCKLLHIRKSRTTPYHPQCDGMVERFNRTLLNMLATHCRDHPWDWEQHIRKVCMAYNSSTNSTTGFTPFYLMFGRQVRLPVDIMYGSAPTDSQSPSAYAVALQKQLVSAYDSVRQTFKVQHERQKEQYDKKIHGDPYVVGDWVWLLNPKVPKNSSKKLFHPWQGPYKVIKKISECTYRVQALKGGRRRQVVHFNRLKPCPKNIRLDEDMQSSLYEDTDSGTSSQELTTSSAPIGTELQLVDDDDDNVPSPSPQDTQASEQTITSDAGAESTRRYPQRQRHAPARYNDYVLSSIRDVCSEEGSNVREEAIQDNS